MQALKSAVQKLTTARWFPTVTKPLLLGALGSGITYALQHVFGVHVLPSAVEAAAAPLVGFLLAAIAQKRTPDSVPPADTAPVPTPPATVGQAVAEQLLAKLAHEIDSDPQLLSELAAKGLERVLNAAQIPAPQTQAPAPPAHMPQT
jgi:hypothetical protein